jgi:aspartyl-tRNA(Asn)/glutamyl-tRNA(Gln) amidotransferase subunit B
MDAKEGEYTVTVGLEIHAELNTKTKMFCACLNNPNEETANTNICPVCMAHPGTLPVINKEAVHKVLQVGTALGSTLSRDYTEFDRKNYFYPDIPKGYQISQYKYPLVQGGALAGVELTRIHLEEDTARSQHVGEKSLVDYNRAGVPLMELVTEPVIHDAETAGRFAKELQLLLRYLGAGEANMEKGEMRVEANISVSKTKDLGTKVEVKNLNSFRSVERAIAYEVTRQSKLLEEGGSVVQETRGWDEVKQQTFSQRKKESSHDYRYFPDPDLPKLVLKELPEFSAESLQMEIEGKLPWEKRAFYTKLGLSAEAAEMFVADVELGRFFDLVLAPIKSDAELVKLATNYVSSDLSGLIKNSGVEQEASIPIDPAHFVSLIQMIKSSEVSSRGAKDILFEMFSYGGNPSDIAKEKGLLQQSDTGALTTIAQKVLDANPTVVAEYKAGKESVMQFLVGQGMKESKGSANPAALRDNFKTLLG